MKRDDHKYIEQLLYYGFDPMVLHRHTGVSLEKIHEIEEKRKQKELENNNEKEM